MGHNVEIITPHKSTKQKKIDNIIVHCIDNKATSTNSAVSHQQFFSERDKCVQTGLQKGWKTVNNITL